MRLNLREKRFNEQAKFECFSAVSHQVNRSIKTEALCSCYSR